MLAPFANRFTSVIASTSIVSSVIFDCANRGLLVEDLRSRQLRPLNSGFEHDQLA
jgi:hypothetical protein